MIGRTAWQTSILRTESAQTNPNQWFGFEELAEEQSLERKKYAQEQLGSKLSLLG